MRFPNLAAHLYWKLYPRFATPPNFRIGPGYLDRWYIVKRRQPLSIYLHKFLKSDDDRALHDHPYRINFSFLLKGEYIEHTIDAGGIHRRTHRKAGDFVLRFGPAPHRVQLINGKPCVTIFGWFFRVFDEREAHWGFHCPEKGWVHWLDFTAKDETGASVSRGCGETE